MVGADVVVADSEVCLVKVCDGVTGGPEESRGGWPVVYISPVIADSPRTRGEANCDWKFQLAFPTAGDPKGWHNVNRGGWSDWWTIASS